MTETLRFCIFEITRFVSPVAVAFQWVLVALAALLVFAVPRLPDVI